MHLRRRASYDSVAPPRDDRTVMLRHLSHYCSTSCASWGVLCASLATPRWPISSLGCTSRRASPTYPKPSDANWIASWPASAACFGYSQGGRPSTRARSLGPVDTECSRGPCNARRVERCLPLGSTGVLETYGDGKGPPRSTHGPCAGARGLGRRACRRARSHGRRRLRLQLRILQFNAVLRNLLALDVHTGFIVWPLRRENGMP